MGSGWLLDNLDVLPTPVAIAASGATAAGLLWWAAARSRGARRNMARGEEIRTERDAYLRALNAVVIATDKGRQAVRWAAEQAAQGAAHTGFSPPAARPRTGDVRVDAVALLEHAFQESWQTVMAAAAHQHQKLNDQAELAEIFKSIFPRLQSLVNRNIAVISEVERDTEDPELLAKLFRMDHLLTQKRRAIESLAVLGGHTPPRDSAPVLLATAIRRAVAEIPEYQRVRVAPSQHGAAALPGYVSPNVVHLLAALMENATYFSSDRVDVFTHQAEDGTAIEVLDRGTGISQRKRELLNRLLAAPEAEDPSVRLREGKIGLLVAALLAKRHKITIQLGPNIVGGTQAVVVIPPELLISADVPNQNDHAAQIPQSSSPSGPARPEHATTHPEDTAELPRQARPAPLDKARPATPPADNDSRPPLPRRGEAEKRVPPPAPQAPAGRATSGLMANFQSRIPRRDEPASQPPDA
ncbi:ATP-binding protein [Streptomyces botrytidirepellens]|uniref:histidine kinase n=1 Tax=Streptomyces botrytidirepellens TaxID=2486417 RepID=A0A3M8X965_9ACTN|nr:ATP-binding protein [Streptomyces botrytidirepellens]RNG37365.1 ATP-binding protein [Streptomyces botrytidirepellens]